MPRNRPERSEFSPIRFFFRSAGFFFIAVYFGIPNATGLGFRLLHSANCGSIYRVVRKPGLTDVCIMDEAFVVTCTFALSLIDDIAINAKCRPENDGN